nr:trypsin-like cysteine/serine peptidase domain-containing protein [Cladorrhinum sp. PSN332]
MASTSLVMRSTHCLFFLLLLLSSTITATPLQNSNQFTNGYHQQQAERNDEPTQLFRDGQEGDVYKPNLRLVNHAQIKPGQIPHSVIRIRTCFQTGSNFCKRASGFVLSTPTTMNSNHQIVVTAGHVVTHSNETNPNSKTNMWASRIEAISGTGKNTQTVQGSYALVTKSYFSRQYRVNDVALVVLEAPLVGVKGLEYKQTPWVKMQNNNVTVYGFPGQTVEEKRRGKLCVSRGRMRFSVGDGLLRHDADAVKGISGGPIVGADGKVVGVHISGSPTSYTGAPVNREGNDFDEFVEVLEAFQRGLVRDDYMHDDGGPVVWKLS